MNKMKKPSHGTRASVKSKEPQTPKANANPAKKATKDAKKPGNDAHDQLAPKTQEVEIDIQVSAATIETVEVSRAEVPASDAEVVLTDAEGRRYCRVRDCDQLASVEAYCRYHYLLYWKRIQVRKKILMDGKLNRYVEELTSRYPDKYLEMIRKDLRSEKEFLAAIAELEIDDSASDGEFDEENDNYLDEVRGMSTETGQREEEEF